MKILTVLRHAKAVEPGGGEDHARGLSGRGRDAARLVGERSSPPELVLCSDALRTRETLDGLLQAWRARPRILYERGLYLAGVAPLLLRLQSIADDISSAWLIGHNPGLHELAQHLAASAAGRREFPVLADRFPTAARAVFALDAASWGELGTAPLAITAFELVD